MDPTKGFTLTPAIIRVLQNVPVEKVEEVLKRAFPKHFFANTDLDRANFLAELRAMDFPKPQNDIDEYIRRMRAEKHSLD